MQFHLHVKPPVAGLISNIRSLILRQFSSCDILTAGIWRKKIIIDSLLKYWLIICSKCLFFALICKCKTSSSSLKSTLTPSKQCYHTDVIQTSNWQTYCMVKLVQVVGSSGSTSCSIISNFSREISV